MGSPDTGPAVFHGLVGDGELAQVVAYQLRLAFHLIEGLAFVDAHHAAHHLGQNDHVAAGASSRPRASPWTVHLSWPCAAASAVSAASSAGRGSAAVAGAHCIAASGAHRTCPAAGRGLRAVGELAEGPLLLLFHFRHPFFRKDLSFCASAVIAESPKSAFLNEYYISVCLETYI